MDIRKHLQILQSAGLSQAEARETLARIDAENEKEIRSDSRKSRADWEKLLKPLVWQIKNLGSSGAHWRKNEKKAAVYTPYLALLRKARDKITTARRFAHMKAQTIPEAAAERGITEPDGLKWSAWIPPHVREPFIIAFDNLEGKHIIPFVTSIEAHTSERRWVVLETAILKHQRTYHPRSLAQRYLTQALMLLRERRTRDIAPINWLHLLPQAARKGFLIWKRNTKDGATEFAADTDTQQ